MLEKPKRFGLLQNTPGMHLGRMMLDFGGAVAISRGATCQPLVPGVAQRRELACTLRVDLDPNVFWRGPGIWGPPASLPLRVLRDSLLGFHA
jgi:hypothetical protein